MLEIKEIKEKNIWENFLLQCEEKTFLQSWGWGEFQKMMGNKIRRMGIFEIANGKLQIEDLIGVALVIKIAAKRGTFLFVPHAPTVALAKVGAPSVALPVRRLGLRSRSYFGEGGSFSEGGAKEGGPVNRKEVLNVLLTKLKEIAKEEKASFIRISPIWQRNQENEQVFKKLNFRNSPIHMHAEVTWDLDISVPEGELLKKMRETTRYLIRRAPRDGVKIIQSKDVQDLGKFNKIYQETVDRHHFVPFSEDYLKKEFSAFLPDDQVSIFLAEYKGEVISAAMIIFWSGIGFYHQGASSLKYPKIPASYYLQWEAIREARKRECRLYNFWGIAPDENSKHPWRGLTLFKMGFGGYKKKYVKTQDYPLSFKYWPIFFFEKIRKAKRAL